jgi:hypothetical protein
VFFLKVPFNTKSLITQEAKAGVCALRLNKKYLKGSYVTLEISLCFSRPFLFEIYFLLHHQNESNSARKREIFIDY